MRITVNWLRELVEFELDVDEIGEVLTAAGLEVEAIEAHRPVWRQVEIAEILAVDPHPNADRLRLCRVRRATGVVSVVCGASNMQPGDRVALAVPGSELPGNRRIEGTTIRGVASDGMLCAAAELALEGEGADGIMILPPAAPVGMRLVDYLGAEDTVLELGVTPNRGDCLSVLGVARELAAVTGATLRRRSPRIVEDGPTVRSLVRLEVEAGDLCPRYCARVIRGVRVGPAEPWMRTRLSMVGLRSISNVVDATNYVLVERGQPLHAFDLARVHAGRIVVRRAGAAQRFTTLDGNAHELAADDLVIADGRGPIALAGVMGGADSEIHSSTSDVLLESAFFVPPTVRRTARRLNLATDASYRFERGVDPDGTAAALDRVTELIVGAAGGHVARGMLERRARRGRRAAIRLRPARVNALLGTVVPAARMRRVLRALGASVTDGAGKTLRVVPPSHRFDLQAEIDLVEEVARLTGYDDIAPTTPAVTVGEDPEGADDARHGCIDETLRAAGFSEMVTLAMVTADENRRFPGLGASGETVALANPLSSDGAELRRSMLPGLLRALVENLRHGEPLVAGYTIGRVYARRAGVYVESRRLGALLAGSWPPAEVGAQPRPCGFGDLKGAIEAVLAGLHITQARWEVATPGTTYLHPGKAAQISIERVVVGVVGALHPDAIATLGFPSEPWVAELDLQELVQYCPRRVIFQSLPRFPAVQRDVAVVVDVGFPAQQVLDVLGEVAQPLLEEVRVFDQYTGEPIPEGKKSLAYTVSYRAADRTLTDDEVNALHQDLVEHLMRRLPLEVRR